MTASAETVPEVWAPKSARRRRSYGGANSRGRCDPVVTLSDELKPAEPCGVAGTRQRIDEESVPGVRSDVEFVRGVKRRVNDSGSDHVAATASRHIEGSPHGVKPTGTA